MATRSEEIIFNSPEDAVATDNDIKRYRWEMTFFCCGLFLTLEILISNMGRDVKHERTLHFNIVHMRRPTSWKNWKCMSMIERIFISTVEYRFLELPNENWFEKSDFTGL